MRFVLVIAKSSLTCKFVLNTAILVTSSGVFCVSYGESSVTCKLELNTALLDFHRLEVSKNPIFHNSSRRPKMVPFIVSYY